MKKIFLLTLAASLAGASPLLAVDLYMTGSTAFRANAFAACQSLYNSAPTIIYGDTAHGGSGAIASSNPQWTMIGNASTKVPSTGSSLVIHAFFTGSVQGIQTVQGGTKLIFADTGVDGQLATTYKTNSPTIAFSDVASGSTPYAVSGNFSEEPVCVQPFVFVKSVAGGGLNNITNITWEQLRYIVNAGRAPLSAWSGNASDHGSFVYLINRTKDSGTRVTSFKEAFYAFNQGVTTYIYDATNSFFYKATNAVAGPVGAAQGLSASIGVVGPAGNGNANLNWGQGYVGGGDVKTEMGYPNIANQAIGYLSIGDAKSIVSGNANNWGQVIPYNGVWPTAAGPGIAGNTGTNDYSPISLGKYPFWSYEMVIYPTVDPSSLNADQNLTVAQLGDQNTPNTILGVLDSQTPGTPLVGSIEATIEASKASGATAIRLVEMTASRASVGGTITP